MEFLLVLFTNVVWRRSDNELERFIRDALQQIKTVAGVDDDRFGQGEFICNLAFLVEQGLSVWLHSSSLDSSFS